MCNCCRERGGELYGTMPKASGPRRATGGQRSIDALLSRHRGLRSTGIRYLTGTKGAEPGADLLLEPAVLVLERRDTAVDGVEPVFAGPQLADGPRAQGPLIA